MENASKALIMAGGMLLGILIISLFLYAWGLISEYQSSKNSLAEIEDTAKFNEQFSNYDRNGVQGYELLSLINMVTDYNYRKSSDAQAKNDEKYTPITISVSFVNDTNRKKLTQDGGANKLFSSNTYTQNQAGQATKNPFTSIINSMTAIENEWGNVDNATKVAKGFSTIFLSNSASNDNKLNAVKKFNSLSYKNYPLTVDGYNSMITNEKDKAYKYYEYMQFKRSLFNSATDQIEYDNATGRIIKMVFNFDKIY